jgi:hypothetical protein
MHLLTHRRALTVLVLILAASLAATPVLAAPVMPEPGATAAKKAKKRCAKKRACKKPKKKPGSKSPAVGTTLTSANVRINVALLYGRGGKRKIVQVTIFGLTANCSAGGTHPAGGGVRANLSGNSFSGRVDYPAGNFAEVSGTFTGPKAARGTVQIGNVAVPEKGTCDTGKVAFRATG